MVKHRRGRAGLCSFFEFKTQGPVRRASLALFQTLGRDAAVISGAMFDVDNERCNTPAPCGRLDEGESQGANKNSELCLTLTTNDATHPRLAASPRDHLEVPLRGRRGSTNTRVGLVGRPRARKNESRKAPTKTNVRFVCSPRRCSSSGCDGLKLHDPFSPPDTAVQTAAPAASGFRSRLCRRRIQRLRSLAHRKSVWQSRRPLRDQLEDP